MTKIMNMLKYKWIGLLLASLVVASCDNEDNVPDKQVTVVISSPTVEPDGSLSLNATASFNAEITDPVDGLNLIYEWSLDESRGTLVFDDKNGGNLAQSSGASVLVRGDQAGEETIRVKVLNEETGKSLGEDLLSFEITLPTSVSTCFDEPLLFYRNNNWNNPAMVAIGLESDTRKTFSPPSQNWLFDISPDGNWFLRQDYSDQPNFTIWMDACDGSESKLLAEGRAIYHPTFGPNGEYVYYSEMISYPEQTQDPRANELVRVNIETGEKVFISDFRVFSSEPRVSPDGNWIAFKHSESTFNPNGTYAGSITHLAVMPSEGGPAQLLVPIEANDLSGYNWSPDSEHLIFNWHKQSGSSDTHTNGIYRVNRSGSGTHSLIFAEPKGYGIPIYYANGTRIAFNGYPSGNDTQFDIWSIDANGGDLQRLTDERYNVFLSFIWEP